MASFRRDGDVTVCSFQPVLCRRVGKHLGWMHLVLQNEARLTWRAHAALAVAAETELAAARARDLLRAVVDAEGSLGRYETDYAQELQLPPFVRAAAHPGVRAFPTSRGTTVAGRPEDIREATTVRVLRRLV